MATSTFARDENSDPGAQSPSTAVILIIVGAILAVVIIIFWIWMWYRRSNGCTHEDELCKCKKMRKCLDWIAFGTSNHNAAENEKEWDWEEGRGTRRYVLGSDLSRRILGDGPLERPRGSLFSRISRRMSRSTTRASTCRGNGDDGSEVLPGIAPVKRAYSPTHTRKDSGKTILAELDVTLDGPEAVPLPPLTPKIQSKNRVLAQWPQSSAPSPSRAVVAKVQTATIISGRQAAAIVAVGKKGYSPIGSASGSIQDPENDLREMPAFPIDMGILAARGPEVGDRDAGEEPDISLQEKEAGERERQIREDRKLAKRKRLEVKSRERAGSEAAGLLSDKEDIIQ